MKVVLDTNVLMAARGTQGLCEAVYAVGLIEHEIIVSEYILAELANHLGNKFKLPQQAVDDAIALTREQATVVQPIDVPPTACRNQDDLPVLGTLLAGKADCLVTGDRDLLDLGSYEGKPILSPRGFYDSLSS